jgi:hypothetical protein
MYKIRDNIYWNESRGTISVINLSTTGEATLNVVWKQRKGMWYVVEPGSKKNVIDVLTPRQFHEAIKNGKYSLKW